MLYHTGMAGERRKTHTKNHKLGLKNTNIQSDTQKHKDRQRRANRCSVAQARWERQGHIKKKAKSDTQKHKDRQRDMETYADSHKCGWREK